MTTWLKFLCSQTEAGEAAEISCAGDTVACFGDVDQAYTALKDGVALVDRSYRSMLEITGDDRVNWLHNLITNQVKTLGQGEGHYAFALNLKGRILFDLCLFVKPNAIWLDIDRRFFSLAQTHFQKYIITEDVALSVSSDTHVRFSLVGPRTTDIFVALGATHVANLPMYNSTDIELGKVVCTAFRTDFCGVFAVDLNVPAEKAKDVWNFLGGLTTPCGVVLVGDDAVQRLRIEAGIPWPGYEITQQYLPAETGQFEQAVAINKGCYLGQEVVERMRSRGALARRLVALNIESTESPPLGADVVVDADADGATIGHLTSVCRSSSLGQTLALGYVKSTLASASAEIKVKWEHGLSKATVVEWKEEI